MTSNRMTGTPMTSTFSARAENASDSPARYAGQLVSHLGRRVAWHTTAA